MPRSKVAVFVEYVVGGQQLLMEHLLYLAPLEQGGAVEKGLFAVVASLGVGGGKPHQYGQGRGQLRR